MTTNEPLERLFDIERTKDGYYHVISRQNGSLEDCHELKQQIEQALEKANLIPEFLSIMLDFGLSPIEVERTFNSRQEFKEALEGILERAYNEKRTETDKQNAKIVDEIRKEIDAMLERAIAQKKITSVAEVEFAISNGIDILHTLKQKLQQLLGEKK